MMDTAHSLRASPCAGLGVGSPSHGARVPLLIGGTTSPARVLDHHLLMWQNPGTSNGVVSLLLPAVLLLMGLQNGRFPAASTLLSPCAHWPSPGDLNTSLADLACMLLVCGSSKTLKWLKAQPSLVSEPTGKAGAALSSTQTDPLPMSWSAGVRSRRQMVCFFVCNHHRRRSHAHCPLSTGALGELFAGPVAMDTWVDRMSDRVVIHLVNNSAVLAALV